MRAPNDVLVHLRRARDLADLEFAEPSSTSTGSPPSPGVLRSYH